MKIIQIPFINGLGKTKGCENSGEKIIELLNEIYSNEQKVLIDTKLLDIQKLSLKGLELEKDKEKIYEFSFDAFKKNSKIAFLGGDHSISYFLTRAFFDYCQSGGKEESEIIKEPCLIVFDAHPDLMPVAFSNAPTHEEWLRKLIDDGFPKENILLIGIRNSDKKELNFIKENKIKTLSIDSFLEDFQNSCDGLTEFVNGRELYVSIDIDVLDPAFAPATGYKEPAGFTSREFIYIIKRISKIRTLKAVDIVEINLIKDNKYDYITNKLGAKILSELL